MNWNEFAVSGLETSRWLTLSSIEDLSDEEMMFQPADGLNHPLWLLGHIVTSENGLILSLCKDENLLPGDWMAKFGIGSKPVADPMAYPSRTKVLDQLKKTHATAVEYVRSLTLEDLDRRPVGIDRFPKSAQERFSTVAKAVCGHISHEAGHAGQISMLRRLMGRPPRV